MNSISNYKLCVIFLIASMLIISSCGKVKVEDKLSGTEDTKTKNSITSAGVREGEVEISIEYFKPRRIYKIEKEDLNNDKSREIIVLSVLKDTSQKYVSFYNFDMIEIFSLNKEKEKFEKIYSDTVDYSVDCRFEDLDKKGSRQILINTNTGGNDKITSNGMFIFGMNENGKVDLINYFDSGNPEIDDIKKDGSKQILVSDEYWGVMPELNVIGFVKDIFIYENNSLEIKNSEFGEYYDMKITELKEKYYSVKRKVEMGMQLNNLSFPLYREATEVIVNYYAKGDMQGLGKFWNEEKESLRKNIPEDEFTDLSNFVFKVLPAAKNA